MKIRSVGIGLVVGVLVLVCQPAWAIQHLKMKKEGPKDVPTQLAPSQCLGQSSWVGSSSIVGGRYNYIVIIRDTPECVQAMLTLKPDLSAFPLPNAPGWTFRRQ